jgi:hypothetical protein
LSWYFCFGVAAVARRVGQKPWQNRRDGAGKEIAEWLNGWIVEFLFWYLGVVVGDVVDRKGWRKGMDVKFRVGKRKKQKHL